MEMEDLLKRAKTLEEQAWQVVKDIRLMEVWQSVGATVNVVGSLATGLMMNHRDIDCHIYTNPFSLLDSFAAMARLAENPSIRTISYVNLLDAEDNCLEWHALYESPGGQTWKIDMIHIVVGSPFDGYFEQVAKRVSQALTPDTRRAILAIKDAMPENKNVMGIEIYQAVIQGGVRDIAAFWQWKEKNPETGIITWMP